MSILLIAGSPSEHSRSAALLDAVSERLGLRQALIERLHIRDLSPQALLLADVGHKSIRAALGQVEAARAIVVATPVYKAAYSGVLKVFLDLLPQSALQGKVVLPLATGGSPHHMLALDYALRPVLQSLAAQQILPGVYATDAQVPKDPQGEYAVGPDIATRLDEAVSGLLRTAFASPASAGSASAGFAPVPFAQVRCSV
ncbi:MAG: NADPH-dependent FMN reductase [Hydrogenophaga sp.]